MLIEAASIGITGYTAVDWLRENHHIDVELVNHRHFMPLISFAHGPAEIEHFLVRAVRGLVDAHRGADGRDIPRLPEPPADTFGVGDAAP